MVSAADPGEQPRQTIVNRKLRAPAQFPLDLSNFTHAYSLVARSPIGIRDGNPPSHPLLKN